MPTASQASLMAHASDRMPTIMVIRLRPSRPPNQAEAMSLSGSSRRPVTVSAGEGKREGRRDAGDRSEEHDLRRVSELKTTVQYQWDKTECSRRACRNVAVAPGVELNSDDDAEDDDSYRDDRHDRTWGELRPPSSPGSSSAALPESVLETEFPSRARLSARSMGPKSRSNNTDAATNVRARKQ